MRGSSAGQKKHAGIAPTHCSEICNKPLRCARIVKQFVTVILWIPILPVRVNVRPVKTSTFNTGIAKIIDRVTGASKKLNSNWLLFVTPRRCEVDASHCFLLLSLRPFLFDRNVYRLYGNFFEYEITQKIQSSFFGGWPITIGEERHAGLRKERIPPHNSKFRFHEFSTLMLRRARTVKPFSIAYNVGKKRQCTTEQSGCCSTNLANSCIKSFRASRAVPVQ